MPPLFMLLPVIYTLYNHAERQQSDALAQRQTMELGHLTCSFYLT